MRHPSPMQARVTTEEPMPARPHEVSPLMMVTVARSSGEAPAAVARTEYQTPETVVEACMDGRFCGHAVMQARVRGEVRILDGNIYRSSPARTVLLLRARTMLVAQSGIDDGGSALTAAVDRECQ